MSSTSWDGPAPADRAEGRTLRGIRSQLRVIYALFLREMQTRFGRGHLGFLWLFIEPVLLAFMIALMKVSFSLDSTHGTINPFVFALVCYLPFFAFRGIVGRAPGTLRTNMTLLYHPQIKLIDAVLARHALEMAAIITVMMLIAAGVAIYGDSPPADIMLLIYGLVLLFLLANGLGLLAAAGSAWSPLVERLIHPLTYLSLPLSGALTPMASFPPILRDLMLWNPQVHIHEMVREGFFGGEIQSYFDVGYVTLCVGIVNLLGLAALRAVRPKLEF